MTTGYVLAANLMPAISILAILTSLMALECQFGPVFSLSQQPQALLPASLLYLDLFTSCFAAVQEVGINELHFGRWLVASLFFTTTIPLVSACSTSMLFFYAAPVYLTPLLLMLPFLWVHFCVAQDFVGWVRVGQDVKRDEIHK